ncbi:MAG: tol-pal system protein YbgF [Deltaproteobacteria bacterium]|nr:tol-pal system protein YbgF [Deltaproteobacteria bacterium]
MFLVVGGFLGSIFFAPGCASTSAPQVKKLKERLADLSQSEAAREKQLETLSNRVFLLEDKVDTSRVALARRRRPQPVRLPVVRIRPGDSDAVEVGARESTGMRRVRGLGSGRSLVASEDVEYEGAATQNQGPRRVLRLRGRPAEAAAPSSRAPSSRAPSSRAPSSRRLSGIDPSTVKDKIPVVPVAKGKIARAMAKAAPGSTVAMRAYTKALTSYRTGRYSAAASSFRSFLGRYAKHSYADNALYWLGECFYDLKNFRLSAKMFRRVVEEYPNGNKAPAALLKLGFSYMKLNEKKNARTVLAQVVEIFPRTGVSRLARRELKRLKIQ